VAKHGSVKGFEGADEITDRAQFWSVDCDILIPAALEQQITQERRRIKPRSSGRRQQPDHPGGRRHPARQGRADRAGRDRQRRRRDRVYFEWVQDFSSFFWTEKRSTCA
jgi:glutamate dehydrogenase (NAD(P)+)